MESEDAFSAPSTLTPARMLVIFRRQWWVIAACLLLAAAGSIAYTHTRTASFSATATVTVTPLTAAAAGAPSQSLPNLSTEIKDRKVVDAARAAAGSGASLHLSAGNSSATTISVYASSTSGPAASRAAYAAAAAFAKQRSSDIDGLVRTVSNNITNLSSTLDKIDANGKPTGAAAVQANILRTELGGYYTEQTNLKEAAFISRTGALPTFTEVANSKKQVIEVALVAGLLIGCGIALISEQLDDRLRSISELPEIGTPGLLAELPTRAASGRAGSIVANPHDELSEAVRELRTALRFLSVERPMRTLLVTSPAAGEGKSFVAANLAASFAFSGVRTVLVSSDLRRPRLEELFETPPSVRGLSDAIADAALAGRRSQATGTGPRRSTQHLDVARLLQPTGIDDLRLLPAGASPPNPAELLGSAHMATVLKDLQGRADVVILDSPPVLAVTDALVLTAHADGVIVVLAKGRTSRGAARRALRLLSSGLAPVFGVVVNRSTRADLVPYPYIGTEDRMNAGIWRRVFRTKSRADRPRRDQSVASGRVVGPT